MKQYLIIFGFLFLIMSCYDVEDTSKVKKGQKTPIELAPKNKASKSNSVKPKKKKRVASKKTNKVTTKAAIKRVNKVSVSKQKMPVTVPNNGLFLSGFAIDKPNNSLAKEVYFLVGETEILSKSYGIPKKGIANAFGKEYLKSGFNEQVLKKNLPKGTHEIKLKVVSSKNTHYIVNTPVTIVNE